jgi:putative ABC transport system substrate-binding protein
MRRREFIALVAGAAAWPLTGRAQQTGIPVIGYLSAFPPHPIDNFVNGLKQVGLVDGQNLRIEYRWAEGRYERLPGGRVGKLLGRVVVAISLPSALAAKGATTTIPVVFESGADPVELGLVDSLSRPTGNLTGISFVVCLVYSAGCLFHPLAVLVDLIATQGLWAG